MVSDPSPASPNSQADHIAYVGLALRGEEWKTRLAAGLDISRSQLFEWRLGTSKTRRDIDCGLIALIDRERDASNKRGLKLFHLRTKMLPMIGASYAV
ncbi:hypothetical protein M2171_002596 [Bradyrhizobium japonicum USDA 38]|uniref:hypothetical protein n=1 Tax=Bradyrhizobium japonicum TaxID=375 RepID=UPI000428ED10|nr:hypothetical protein [Bradyrhizobium japonicum]MCS3893463.1 hypothetical protein [Bradyrhizobium japonicum USDA 38]MCS3945977.1 hypothetical protein [Bradyrhizobium japonicum]